MTVSQRFGQRATLTAGKINLSTLLNRAPLLGGGGVDTFMNVMVAAPVSGITPRYLTGAILNVASSPLRYTVMVYDPRNAQSRDVWKHLFADGVVISVSAMRPVPIKAPGPAHRAPVLGLTARVPSALRPVPRAGAYNGR